MTSISLHLIINTIRALRYQLSTFLAHLLAPHVGLYGYHIKNTNFSVDIVDSVRHIPDDIS